MKKQFKETFRITTTRPVAILMIVVAVFVFGMISYYRLSLNLMPDISYPSLTVRTEYQGTAPEEIETIISRPVEQALGIVSNLVNISSISKAGFSDVILEFTWDTDMNLAIQDVREKLDQVYLPPEVKRPLILRYDPTLDPILRFGLYGEMDLYSLRRTADEDIRRELETLPGVAAVKVKGGLEEEIRVEISEDQLAVLNIDINEINIRLSQENINLAGGNLKEGETEYLVRTLNEFRTLEEISGLIIGRRNGAEIRIKDIGKVHKTYKEREVITRVNGVESVDIEIFKEADANIVSVAEIVKTRVFGTPAQQDAVNKMNSGLLLVEDSSERRRLTNFLTYSLPEGVNMEVLTDQSIFIKSSLDEVRNTAIIGGVLAIIVLYFFLRSILSTLIIGLAIPISVIATFAPMYIFDVSLNIMSLGGLALGIGMLVDNSIVVLESIFRCREEGDSIVDAAVRGAGEVGSAVTASTLTTIAVFFPIVFVEGIAGQIFGDMSLVVVFSLLASLLAALFFIPMLASRQINREKGSAAGMISAAEIVRFESFQRISVKLEELKNGKSISNAASLYLSLFVNMFSSLYELLKKCSQVLVSAVLVSTEAIIVMLTGIFAWIKRRDFKDSAGAYRSVLPDVFGTIIWQDFMRFNAYSEMLDLIGRFSAYRKTRTSFINKAGLLISFPAVFIYILSRFLLQVCFSLAGKLLILCITLIIITISGLLISAGCVALIFGIPLIWIFGKVFDFITEIYPIILEGALKSKGIVLILSAGLFVFCVMYLLPGLGQELIPEMHQGEFNVEFTYPVGTPLEKTSANLAVLEETILSIQGIQKISSITGVEKNSATSKSEEGEHTARIGVTLEKGGNIILKEEAAMGLIREKLDGISGVTTKISRPALFSFKTPVEVEISGYNLEILKNISREIESRLKNITGLTDVRSSIQRGSPEVQIKYDRLKLARNNLNIYQVATLVKNKIKGLVATEFKDKERRIDILVRVREEDKANLRDLFKLVVNPGAPVPVPLSAVAQISINEGPSEIRRINQQRVALVTANISGVDLGTITGRIEDAIRTVSKPDDFSFEITGQNKEMQTSMDSLKFALLLAVFLIYVVMASQFESLIHPFVILFTIPLAVIGVIIALYAMNISISVVVFIGMIMLAGIVVNNAIVLVDYINQLRRRGMKKVEAIILAGKVRLRPIIMTTSTTVLGLLPMALGLGDGSEIRTPMAITVIAGLLSATVLTLIVIPTVYALFDWKE